jgi:hypothetical protein
MSVRGGPDSVTRYSYGKLGGNVAEMLADDRSFLADRLSISCIAAMARGISTSCSIGRSCARTNEAASARAAKEGRNRVLKVLTMFCPIHP